MARLFVQHVYFCNNINLPQHIKKLPEHAQNIAKNNQNPSKNDQRLLKICPIGESIPNLVTLLTDLLFVYFRSFHKLQTVGLEGKYAGYVTTAKWAKISSIAV